MPETIKERKDLDPQYMWDLSTLFQNDDAWEAAFSAFDEKIQKVAAYAGTLKDAETLKKYLDDEEDMELDLMDLYEYAYLRRQEDTREPAAQKMYARAYAKYVEAVTATAFAEPEILSLPEETLKGFVSDPVLKDYTFNLEKLLRRKPHILSGVEEQLLARFGETFSAPGDIADNLMDADMVYEDALDGEGNPVEVSDASYILLQSSLDRTLRENSFKSLYKGYKQHINTFAATYSGNVKSLITQASVRHYGSSREMMMSGDNVPVSVYDNLISTVRAHMPAMYDYVALRKKMLGVDELHYYDLYAPLVPDDDARYTYKEAQEMVLSAVAPLGEEYVENVRRAYRDHWIDVYPNKGKGGGAFSAGTYRSNPFILANYTGTLNDVSTIAHEMGHSQHTNLSNTHQPPQYAQYTIFVAEVASTVNEILLVQDLLSKTDDKKKRLSYLNQSLETFKGTVYRQTMFAEFEREAHAMAERGEPLDPESLCNLYEGLVRDYFGDGLVIDEEVRYEWARIPHFYNSFYVYKYSTSYCTAMAIADAILKEGEPAAKRYLEFLQMGGSKDPLDELKHAGVDLTTPEPIERALANFKVLVDETAALADE